MLFQLSHLTAKKREASSKVVGMEQIKADVATGLGIVHLEFPFFADDGGSFHVHLDRDEAADLANALTDLLSRAEQQERSDIEKGDPRHVRFFKRLVPNARFARAEAAEQAAKEVSK